jgi:outer membrane protein OmpA-like peptidoglycan-associated protein
MIGGTWQDRALLADGLMRHGERSSALKWYELSLQRQNMPGVAANDQDRDRLFKKAGFAKILANDDQEGRLNLPSFGGSMRDEVSGKIGGVFLAPRGAVVVAVPLPVNFYWNETRFTRAGEQALDELAQAAQEQQVHTIRLVGHADPTGNAQYNMDLSKRRVEAVRDALRSRGIHVNFDLAWRGAQEPIDPKNLDFAPTRDELYALDRRVEWIRNGATD